MFRLDFVLCVSTVRMCTSCGEILTFGVLKLGYADMELLKEPSWNLKWDYFTLWYVRLLLTPPTTFAKHLGPRIQILDQLKTPSIYSVYLLSLSNSSVRKSILFSAVLCQNLSAVHFGSFKYQMSIRAADPCKEYSEASCTILSWEGHCRGWPHVAHASWS